MTGRPERVDEFDLIARLMRPLTRGAPEALELLDDAAVIPSRPGLELVVSKDMIVEGVHFLPSDAPELVARKLLRVNLSDLAAKAARPYGWFLAAAWPAGMGWEAREAFAHGLAEDQERFGLSLMGGDTTATPGPFTASATVLGWAEAHGTLLRSGALPGDLLLVSGVIGDGRLGLRAALGELEAPGALQRYRLPEPRLNLRRALSFASACADVSDGLVADAGRIGIASGVGLQIDLDAAPLSAEGRAHLASAPDPRAALIELVTGGDDYELVCTADPIQAPRLMAEAEAAGTPMTVVGRVVEGQGTLALLGGEAVRLDREGYRHG